MKDYIEVKTEALIQGNKAERMLFRKDEVVQVTENKLPNGEMETEIVIHAAGNTWTKLTVLDSYDEIKAALANYEERAKKTAKRAVHELQLIVGSEGTTDEIYEAFERRLTEILKSED